ncbi:ABC transporter substrate-binding protein [Paracoccus sp. S-4012]|uniref:ABC transporter substrate-binding protein n=1 Tax=Paracoccus sp. S-4012 TaxID=2665648 RepID=UPI0012AF7715|nr:ABC transporter substrate-binding protein [Paracoccus sp. S-4012]MRX52045.1 ABC transporter substrate-binding protein [Paracoccus sp. S-4012]
MTFSFTVPQAVAASAALVLTGFSAQAQTVQIGVGIDPTFVAFFVAEENGLFEQHGIDVDLVTFGPGGAMVDGMMAGQAHMTASTETTHLVRMPHSDIRPLGLVGESGDNLKLVADGDLSEPGEIRKLGVVPGGVFEYLTDISIDKLGIDRSTLELVRAGPPELPALLARGDIEAFWLFEPFPTRVVAEQQGQIFAHSKDVGYTYAFWVSASGPWLEANRDSAHRVMAALADACAVVTSQPEVAAEAVQKQVKIPVDQTLDFLRETECIVRDFTDEDLAAYDSIATFLTDRGFVKEQIDFRPAMQVGFLSE